MCDDVREIRKVILFSIYIFCHSICWCSRSLLPWNYLQHRSRFRCNRMTLYTDTSEVFFFFFAFFLHRFELASCAVIFDLCTRCLMECRTSLHSSAVCNVHRCIRQNNSSHLSIHCTGFYVNPYDLKVFFYGVASFKLFARLVCLLLICIESATFFHISADILVFFSLIHSAVFFFCGDTTFAFQLTEMFLNCGAVRVDSTLEISCIFNANVLSTTIHSHGME